MSARTSARYPLRTQEKNSYSQITSHSSFPEVLEKKEYVESSVKVFLFMPIGRFNSAIPFLIGQRRSAQVGRKPLARRARDRNH